MKTPSKMDGLFHAYTINADHGLSINGGEPVRGAVIGFKHYRTKAGRSRYALDIGRKDGTYIRITFNGDTARNMKLAEFYRSYHDKNTGEPLEVYKSATTGCLEAYGHTIRAELSGLYRPII